MLDEVRVQAGAGSRRLRAHVGSGAKSLRRQIVLAALFSMLASSCALFAAQAAAASTFPATELLDSFQREGENPLFYEGRWSKLAWAKTSGEVHNEKIGWRPSAGGLEAPETEADGGYWNVREFTGPAVSVHIRSQHRKDYVALWADTTGAGSKNGYRLKVLGTSSEQFLFKLILERWVNGTRTQLAESPAITFGKKTTENFVGLTAIGGKVKAWYGATEASLAVELEASDTTFSHGHVGLEGIDKAAFGETEFEASQNEAAPSNTELPKVTGPAIVGQQEKASTGTWIGTQPISYTYQWERCEGSSCATITGATNSTYVAAQADAGKTLRVKVTATNSAGSSSAVSPASPTVTAPPLNTELPSVSGQAIRDHFEHAAGGTWTGTQPISYAFQWERCNSQSCSPLGGETATSYLTQNADLGNTLRIKVTATNSAGSSTAYSSNSPAIANTPCGLYTTHCYAIAEQCCSTTAGLNVAIETSFASVPYWEEDRMQNEAWANFTPGVTWVEGGATTGWIASGRTTAYVYFTATKLANGTFTERDFEDGPGGNTYFPVDEHYIGSNIWYITVGSHTIGYGEEPTTSSSLQAGLEETNDNIVNWGHLANLSWWDPVNGVKHEEWNPEGSFVIPASPAVTCISLQGHREAYFVANGEPCTLGAALSPSNSLSQGGSAEASARPLTAGGALAKGLRFASQNAGTTAPKSIHVYSASEAKAMAVAQPHTTVQGEQPSATQTYVEVMHGEFTLGAAPVPPGADPPKGRYLTVVDNAATGRVLSVTLSDSSPNLSGLGGTVASSG
jgi:hypothetical protein